MNALLWRVKRAMLNLRQRDVADRTEMSQSRYSLVERGEATPTSKELEAINTALQLPDNLGEELWRDATGRRYPNP
jgi:transcriptional regulator with XRE-family HTH domain